MQKLKFFLIFLCFVGCARLDPKINPHNNTPINNTDGDVEARNNQNGVMLELAKLNQKADLQNSQLKEVQNGLVNLNTSLSRNENSGIQILQGDGALIMVFSLAVIFLLFVYRNKAIKNEKISNLMAKEIARFNHGQLNDNVLYAAANEKCERKVFDLIKKNQSLS